MYLIRESNLKWQKTPVEVNRVSNNFNLKKMTKQRDFFVTACIACLSVLPSISVKAQFQGGDGSSGDPYQIATASQLDSLARRVNAGDTAYNDKHYKLTADIDLSDYGSNFNSGKGWIPIGSATNIFSGIFDGDFKIITGLYINDVNGEYVGLFGRAYDTIKNLSIANANVTGKEMVGGVAGSQAVLVINCYVVTSTINGNGSVGGVVGMGRVVKNCYFTGTVNGSGDEIGGIIGYTNWGSCVNCYSTSTVNGKNYVGGVVGSVVKGDVTNSYSTGIVNGTGSDVGGIAGYLGDYNVSNCVALNPSVETTGTDVGRVVGSNHYFLQNNAAWNGILNNAGNTTWNNKGLDKIDGADMTAAAIKADSSLGGRFKIADGWTLEKGKLPGLFGQAVDMPEHIQDVNYIPNISQPNILKIYIQNGTLYINGLTAGEVWSVYNMLGMCMYEGIANDDVETWNASFLPNGIYVVRSGSKTGKIIKQGN